MTDAMTPLLSRSALELAAMIRRGEITSLEVVEAHIGRVEEVNGRLNLVVAERFEQARAEARAADLRVGSGVGRNTGGEPSGGGEELPPYWGVPCSIKEAMALAGMPNSAGLYSRRHVVAQEDATGVARLRAAGAIPLGVTNVSELCMWMESDNSVYGRSRNPYDPSRTVGGSSGGEGGVVGAGAVPFGLGSDVGGSIRLPAFFCGVFGHKPTGGLVPYTGQYPPAEGALLRYVTTGPLARRAEDLMPLLRILAGPDGKDPGSLELELGDPASVDLSELVVLDVPDNGHTPVSADLRRAQGRAMRWLQEQGARVERLEVGPGRLEGLRWSLPIWAAMMAASEGSSYRDLLADGAPFSLGREILLALLGRSRYTVPSLGLVAAELVPKLFPGGQQRYVDEGARLRQELAERLSDRVVMLYPVYSEPAPRHNKPLLPPWRWVYTAILNVLEVPSTQVPLGLNRRGLPLGVQVVGGHGQDHLTIAVAQALERGFGGWVMPPL